MTATDNHSDLQYREGHSGGCYKNGEEVCVHRNEDFCDEGTWATAHYLRANSGHPLRSCAFALESVVIGRCEQEGRCTNLAENCEETTAFNPYDNTCTTTQDLRDYSPVTYGRCDDRCVWSDLDCIDGETYIRNDPNCTAEKVEIGACWAGSAWCAISSDSCNQAGEPFEPYLSHQETKDQIGVSCFLSKIPSAPTPATVPPLKYDITLAPSAAPTTTNEIPLSTSETPTALPTVAEVVAKAGRPLSTGTVAAIAVAGAIVIGMLLGFLAHRSGQRSAKIDDKTAETHRKPPMQAVDTVDPIIDDDEELSIT